MQDAAAEDNMSELIQSHIYQCQKESKTVCQNAKSIFNYSSGTGEPIIKYSLLCGEVTQRKGLQKMILKCKRLSSNKNKLKPFYILVAGRQV